jgi:hypothetical protein
MHIRIRQPLFIGFLLASMVALTLTTMLTGTHFQRVLLKYVNRSAVNQLLFLSAQIKRFCETEDSWYLLDGDLLRWRELIAPLGFEEPDAVGSFASVYRSVVWKNPLAISPPGLVVDGNGRYLFARLASDTGSQIVASQSALGEPRIPLALPLTSYCGI